MSPAAPERPGPLALGGAAHPTLAPAAAPRAPSTAELAGGHGVPALARRLAGRLGGAWLPRVAWSVGRTGRAGLVGVGLLLAAAVFLVSTHLPVAAEVEALRADLARAQEPGRAAPDEVADVAAPARALPARTEMPAILRQLFGKATQARLALDSGKYEISATRTSGVVRYHVALPVTGPYPQIRSFLDSALATMPAVGLDELVLERKSISDANVEAQIRMTVYTAATGPARAGAATAAGGSAAPPSDAAGAERARAPARPRDAAGRAATDRVVSPAHAGALFAQHSWFVLPLAPPPAPPPPPPDPTAPPLPYAFLGSFTPDGEKPVYFLSRGDRVIDAHVGDQLDGVYRLESAAGGQLVFVYLPLDVRQTLAAGASR